MGKNRAARVLDLMCRMSLEVKNKNLIKGKNYEDQKISMDGIVGIPISAAERSSFTIHRFRNPVRNVDGCEHSPKGPPSYLAPSFSAHGWISPIP